jgi:hypothetical protein
MGRARFRIRPRFSGHGKAPRTGLFGSRPVTRIFKTGEPRVPPCAPSFCASRPDARQERGLSARCDRLCSGGRNADEMRSPLAGASGSRPVSRILSRVTISLGRRLRVGSSGVPGSSAGRVNGTCFTLHRTGFS